MVDIDKDAICCPICTDILYSAVETGCGHAFCQACLGRWLDNNATTCPMCKRNPHPVHPSFTLRSICEQYYKKQPNQFELMLREKELGNDFYQKRQYWKAIEHYTIAIQQVGESNSRCGVLYSNRSQCYIKLFKYGNALADCEKAIAMSSDTDTNVVKARMRKGSCLMHLGDLGGSVIEFELAAKLDSLGTFAKEIQQCLNMLPPPQELPNYLPESPIVPPTTNNTTVNNSIHQSPLQHPSPPHTPFERNSSNSGSGSNRRRRRRKDKCIIM